MAKSGTKLLLAAALGLAAGIGVGILLAPEKGSKTRKKLKKRFLEFAGMLREEFDEKSGAFASIFSEDKEEESAGESATKNNPVKEQEV
jgi:gas vesicle protein